MRRQGSKSCLRRHAHNSISQAQKSVSFEKLKEEHKQPSPKADSSSAVIDGYEVTPPSSVASRDDETPRGVSPGQSSPLGLSKGNIGGDNKGTLKICSKTAITPHSRKKTSKDDSAIELDDSPSKNGDISDKDETKSSDQIHKNDKRDDDNKENDGEEKEKSLDCSNQGKSSSNEQQPYLKIAYNNETPTENEYTFKNIKNEKHYQMTDKYDMSYNEPQYSCWDYYYSDDDGGDDDGDSSNSNDRESLSNATIKGLAKSGWLKKDRKKSYSRHNDMTHTIKSGSANNDEQDDYSYKWNAIFRGLVKSGWITNNQKSLRRRVR